MAEKLKPEKANKAYQALGAQIRALRKKRGWSQEELAHHAGVHVTYLSGLERGHRNPSLNIIVQLASALKVTPSELLKKLDAGFLRK